MTASTSRIVLLGIVLWSLLPVPASGQDMASQIDAVFAAYDNTRSPGCAVGVIQEGAFLFKRGYGMANLEHGLALTPTSIFRIGSTSKQFTAAVIHLLALEGHFSLDDDIRTIFPEFPVYERPVTIRHMLHHTSGLRDYLTLMTLAGKRDDDFYTDDDVMAMLARQQDLNFLPGDEYLYSNSGYFLMSQIVKRTTGLSLRAYAQEKVFAPLGMHHTHFHDDPAEVVPERADGYAPTSDGGFRLSMTTLGMVGDGGVFTSVEDLLAWDRAFYEPWPDSPGFWEAMLQQGVLNSGEVLPYASGLRHGTYQGLDVVSHGGSFVGFRAEMMRFPAQETTIICLCNLSTAAPTRLAHQVADVVLGDEMEPAEATSIGDVEASLEAGEAASRTLTAGERGAYAGSYYSEELATWYHVRQEDEALHLRVGNELDGPLESREDDVLRTDWLTLRFTRDEGGVVTGFLLDAGRVKNLRFTRRAASP